LSELLLIKHCWRRFGDLDRPLGQVIVEVGVYLVMCRLDDVVHAALLHLMKLEVELAI